MDKYIINGVEWEYDTFDLDNMEAFYNAVNQIKDDAKDIAKRNQDGNAISALREQAHSVLDFFDAVLGEGAADKIFGGRLNYLDIMNGYKDFYNSVSEQMGKLKQVMAPPMNREQRREQRRDQR